MAENPTRYSPDRVHAVVVDAEGFVLDDEDIDAWADRFDEESEWFDEEGEADDEQEPHRVLIVTGTAVPRSQSEDRDDYHRLPDGYRQEDVLAEHDVSTLPAEDVVELYVAAHAAADAENR